MKSFLCILSSLLLFGCAMAPTTGDTLDKDVTTNITNTEGLLLLYAPITNSSGYESASKIGGAILDQALEGKAALGYNGSTASLADEGAKQIFEGVSSLAEWWMNKEKEEPAVPAEEAPVQVIPTTPPSKVPVEVPAEVTTPTPTDPVTSVDVLERGKFSKRHPENNRPYWYFKEEMKDYPADFDIVVEGCGRVQVRGNTGERIDWDEERNVTTFNENRNRWFLRQSLIPNDPRNMVLVAPQGCAADKGSELAYITVPKSVEVEYLFPQTYSMQALEGNNKYFTWLGWKWTDKVKSPVKFVFKDCGENLVVPNVQEPYGTDGSGSNHNQMFYFSGNPAKQEDTNNDFASIFGPPGCIAKTVDVYLSK